MRARPSCSRISLKRFPALSIAICKLGNETPNCPVQSFTSSGVSRVTLISSNNFGRMPPNAVLGLMFLPSRLAMTLGQFASVERLDGGRIMRMKAGLLAPPTSRSRLAEQSATYRAGVRSRRRKLARARPK